MKDRRIAHNVLAYVMAHIATHRGHIKAYAYHQQTEKRNNHRHRLLCSIG